jgi:hypothetical protein
VGQAFEPACAEMSMMAGWPFVAEEVWRLSYLVSLTMVLLLDRGSVGRLKPCRLRVRSCWPYVLDVERPLFLTKLPTFSTSSAMSPDLTT